MALKDITEKILSDARLEAQKIVDSSTVFVEEEHKRVDARVSVEESDYRSETEHMLADRRTLFSSCLQQELQLDLQTKKRAIVEGVFADLRSSLLEKASSDYALWCRSCLRSYDGENSVSMVVPVGMSAVARDVVKELGKNFSVVERNDVVTGFVLEGENFVGDFSVERLLDERRKEVEVVVAGVLFEND